MRLNLNSSKEAMHMSRLWVVLLTFPVFLCARGIAAEHDIALPKNMTEFKHINTFVVTSADDPLQGIHHFYINETGLQTFRKGVNGGSYPAGTEILGKVYKPIEIQEGQFKEGTLAAYTFMVKDPNSSRTAETGGWHFLKFEPGGDPIQINPVRDCFGCHMPHKKSDYVLSEPLE
jgi:hypothetical protein